MTQEKAAPTARLAGKLLLVVAALYGALLVMQGQAASGVFGLGVILILVALAAGLARGIMWVTWLAFVAALAGTATAVAGLAAPGLAPVWVVRALLVCNAAAAVLSFGAIWAGPRPRSD